MNINPFPLVFVSVQEIICGSLLLKVFFIFVFQERLHYETLSQHLGKLGEDAGKMVHRVIDLTRPEDLDGKTPSLPIMPHSCVCFLNS